MAEKRADVILRYKVDKASEDAVGNSLSAVDRRAQALRESVSQLRTRVVNDQSAIETRLDDVRRQGSIEAITSTRSRGVRQGRIIDVGTRALSQIGLGEAGQAVNVVDDLVATMGKFGPVGAVAVGALAGVTIGLKAMEKQLEGVKWTLNAALNAQNTYYKAVEQSTSEQVREQVRTLERQRDTVRKQIEETRRAADSAFQQEASLLGDAVARALDTTGNTPYAKLKEQLDQLETQASETDQSIGRLTQGLANGAFAFNDAKARQEAYNKAVLESARIEADRAGDAVRFQQKISRDTRQSLREQLQERENERIAIQASIDYYRTWASEIDGSDEVLNQYTNQLRAVTDQINDLTEELAKTARARDLWDSVTGFFNGAVDSVADAVSRIKKAGEINQRIAEIRGKGFEDLAKIELDLQERILTIQQDGADRRADILRDAQQSEEKSQRDYLRQRERIERDSNRAILSAIGRRDVLAFVEAQRNRSDQLDDLNKSITEERRVRQQATDERLRDLQRNEQKQIDAARRSASLQIAAVNDRVNKEVYAQQILLQQVFGFTQQRVAIETSGYQAIISAATSAFQQIWAAIPRLTTGGTGSSSGGGGSGSARYSTNYTINGRSVSVEEYLRAARNSLEISGRGR